MLVATEGDENDTKWVDNAYINNEYVELEDLYPTEFQNDGWVDMTVIENISAKHNRFVPLATNDLKVGKYLSRK